MTAEKKCKVEVVRHPVDGIRFESRGEKGVCDEHMHELLKDAERSSSNSFTEDATT